MNDKEQERFEKDSIRLIDSLYRDLYLSDDVLRHSTHNKTDKFNNLREYLKMLESMHDRVLKSKSRKEIIKRLYHDKYVIKYESIPESYYDRLDKMNVDRGYGHIELTEEYKKREASIIIEDQKKSLDDWLDYFLSEKSSVYPFWVKYWAFQGMLRLGKYNKNTGTYNRRTIDTLAPFIELNAEALALSMDLIIKIVKKDNIDDKELKALAASGSFEKIYMHELKSLLKNNKHEIKRNKGVWVRYKKGSNHLVLVNSLRGYNTGWCTAGEETAKYQLTYNDFDVYYTLNSQNEYKVPRIAILHDDIRIREIRGINEQQEIEPEMLDIAKARAKEIDSDEKFFTKEANTRRLTEIYYKYERHEKLTDEEVMFLYNTDMDDYYVKGDERVEYILNKRNRKKDLAKIYGCKEEEVSLNGKNLNKNTKVYVGDWMWERNGFVFPEVVIGDIDLESLTTANVLKLPRVVKGELNLGGLTNANGLVLPEIVTKDLFLSSVEEAKGMILPRVVKGELFLTNLKSIEGLKFPEELGSLILTKCDNLNELVLPEKMSGSIDFRFCGMAPSVSGLSFPKIIGEDVEIAWLNSAENMTFPEYVKGDMSFYLLEYAKNTVFPRVVGGSLNLNHQLVSAENVILPKDVHENLYLDLLENVNNVSMPEHVGGDLKISSLKKGNGLVLPKVIEGKLLLNAKLDLDSVTLPDKVGDKIYLGKKVISLKNLKKLKERGIEEEKTR